MLDFQIPRITAESVEDNRGNFVVEPLDRGFGYTFGNSLRRVLLASLVRGRGHVRPHRGRRARVLDDQGRHRGRDRHRPEPQGRRLPHALRRDGDRGPAGRHRPGRDHREGHRPALGRRDPQPGRAHRHAREEDQARALPDDRPRPRLPPGRGEQVGRPADRRHPDRLDLLARAPRRLLRRAGPRRPADGLRQAHARHRDRRLDRPHDGAARGRGDPDLLARDLHRRGPHRGPARGPRRHARRSTTAPVPARAPWRPAAAARAAARWTTSSSRSSSWASGPTTASSARASRRWATSSRSPRASSAAIPNFGKKSIDEVIETLSQRGLGLRTD